MEIDALKIEILEDGTIKTTSDAVSAANHDNAEQFLRAMARLAGGETTREARKDVKHGHIHEHGSRHMHQGR
jgi:phage terminase large subunit-like protein